MLDLHQELGDQQLLLGARMHAKAKSSILATQPVGSDHFSASIAESP
jgi:hypothetical protein